MTQYIIITSIFPPTEAVEAFSKVQDHQLIVVGDKKTPDNWQHNNVQYLSVQDQEDSGYALAKVMPYNHYCRKMLGYLEAMKQGAETIVDTDDDNIPKANWQFPSLEATYSALPGGEGFVNIYQLFTDQKIWPRGLPLNLINTDFQLEGKLQPANCKVGIWQGLADEDPDVDAIYRLTSDTLCNFKERSPVVLPAGTVCPFNSQNTLIRKELFPLLYLPTFVTFRFTDILRGLVAQPIMNLYNYQLGFTQATVVQKRNPHDYMKDFESEIPMYLHCENVLELTRQAISANYSIKDNLHLAYEAFMKAGIVSEQEMTTLEAWLTDQE
jgi:hypothetical protein